MPEENHVVEHFDTRKSIDDGIDSDYERDYGSSDEGSFHEAIDEQADEYVPLSDGSVEEGGDIDEGSDYVNDLPNDSFAEEPVSEEDEGVEGEVAKEYSSDEYVSDSFYG